MTIGTRKKNIARNTKSKRQIQSRIQEIRRRPLLRCWTLSQTIATTSWPLSQPSRSNHRGSLHPHYLFTKKKSRAYGSASGLRSTCTRQSRLLHNITRVSQESWATPQQGCRPQKRSTPLLPHSARRKNKQRYGTVLILLLLVSNLILVYIFILVSHRYVDKLAPVYQSYMFKRRTVLTLK